MNMRFKDVLDLDKLPYFKKSGGHLFLKKEYIPKGGIVDAHTHLGWWYLFGKQINLWKKTQETHYFFPKSNNPVDFSHYTAFDYLPQNKKRAQIETVRAAIDSSGYSSTHTIPNRLEEMDRLGIKKSIVLAIDFPVVSRNSESILKAVNKDKESTQRFEVYISLHPLEMNKEKKLKEFLKKGAKGIKLHPQIQMFKPTHKGAYEIYDLALHYNLPILFHTGLSPISPRWQGKFVHFDLFKKVILDFPKNIFILGHSGVLDYKEAMHIAEGRESVYLELSGQTPSIIKEMIQKNGYDNLLYGSDWPYYPSALPLAKALIATEGMKGGVRDAILRKNAQRLLGH